jgi:hypothetical protein
MLLKVGGLLIVDNAERYLPHSRRTPESLKGPVRPEWREFLARVADWRPVWTTNGVTCTALWIKT